MVTDNKQINLNYNLRNGSADGKMIESTLDSKPLSFVFGQGKMLPKFEENIAGLHEGDHFQFTIKSADAYGEFQDGAIIDIPLNTFEANGSIDYEMVKIGNMIPMQDSKGQRMDGIVKEVSNDKVKMDFNHPLAGTDLYFEGEILAITEPVVEMANEHNHGEGDGCGCGSGCGCN
jgi:FKBP-type peptidyl-prolyl cis-trans isomerase SlyD